MVHFIQNTTNKSKKKRTEKNDIFQTQGNLKLDVADISFLIKKPNNLVSIYCSEVYELNPKHKSDINIIEKHVKIMLKCPKLTEIEYYSI